MPISRSDCATCAYSRARRASPASRRRRSAIGSDLPHQHEVVALPVVRVAPDHAVRERLEERADLALHRRRVALVELHEQRHDAAGIQVLLDELEELARVERRRALHPRIERVGRDRVELLASSSAGSAARRRCAPSTFGLSHDVVVVLAEVLATRRAARAARFRRSSSCFDVGSDRHRAGRDAGAAADDEQRSRVLRGSACVRWPSMRCSRMSCGSLDACTLPAL